MSSNWIQDTCFAAKKRPSLGGLPKQEDQKNAARPHTAVSSRRKAEGSAAGGKDNPGKYSPPVSRPPVRGTVRTVHLAQEHPLGAASGAFVCYDDIIIARSHEQTVTGVGNIGEQKKPPSLTGRAAAVSVSRG